MIPASLHSDDLNPDIDFKRLNLAVVRQAQALKFVHALVQGVNQTSALDHVEAGCNRGPIVVSRKQKHANLRVRRLKLDQQRLERLIKKRPLNVERLFTPDSVRKQIASYNNRSRSG